MNIGACLLGNSGELGRYGVLAGGRSRPTQHAILAVWTGVQCQTVRSPDNAHRLDRRLLAIKGDVRLQAHLAVPQGKAIHRVADESEQAAVEHHHAGAVQRANQRQCVNRVTQDGPLGCFVEQPPHHHAGMIPITHDHLRNLAIETLGHLRRRLEQPTGVALLVSHQAQLIAQVKLVARRHGQKKRIALKPIALDKSRSRRARSRSCGQCCPIG